MIKDIQGSILDQTRPRPSTFNLVYSEYIFDMDVVRFSPEKAYQSITPTDSPSSSPSSSPTGLHWSNDQYPRHSTPKGSPIIERPTSYSFGQSMLFPYKPEVLSPPSLSSHSSSDSFSKVDLSIPFESYLNNLGDSLRKAYRGKVTERRSSVDVTRQETKSSIFQNPMTSYTSPYFRLWESKTTTPYPGRFAESLSHPAFRQTDNLTTRSTPTEKTLAAKKYKCDVCDKTFSRSNTLVTHKRIHTGEKPFKCEICDRAFRQPGNLTRHRLTHTSIKPYVCTVCNKAFNRASNLQTHMRIHTKGMEYHGSCVSYS